MKVKALPKGMPPQGLGFCSRTTAVQPNRRFARYSAYVLLATLGVIVWGAYVRVSKSGDGCGSHWPLCNGEVIPSSPSVETLIEATHRATSGIAFFMVAAQLIWALRAFAAGSAVRRSSVAAMLLMCTEAGIGAGLVLFEMVAGNKSTARAAWMAVHLLNTFALLAALGMTLWHARHPEPALAPPLPARWRTAVMVGLAGLLATATTGAIAALGDTLFPARTLAEGLAQDFAPGSHLFLRLRLAHPTVAVATAIYLLVTAGLIAGRDSSGRVRPLATLAAALVLGQVALGFINLVLLAPTALQLLHLLVADAVWLAFVFVAAAMGSRRQSVSAAARAAA
jgi:heme A synthase